MAKPTTGSKNPPPKPTKPTHPWGGVFALEGEWDDLTSRTSVLPVLETLEGLRAIDFVRRDIGTRAELDHYLSRWRTELPDYCLLYLGFHGEKTKSGDYALLFSDDPNDHMTVQQLAARLPGSLNGCVVYFGSCSIMDAPKRVLQDFLDATGAKAVMGYTEKVSWVDSAAFDMIVLSWLAKYQQLQAALNKIEDPAYESLSKSLGFKVMRA